MASSERGEYIGITAPFENVSERKNTLYAFNTNDDNFPDKVIELSVPGTHLYRQPPTHHSITKTQAAKWVKTVIQRKISRKKFLKVVVWPKNQSVHHLTNASAWGIDSVDSRDVNNTSSEPLPQDW